MEARSGHISGKNPVCYCRTATGHQEGTCDIAHICIRLMAMAYIHTKFDAFDLSDAEVIVLHSLTVLQKQNSRTEVGINHTNLHLFNQH
eukprot:6214110-Pleurochrysis_carterae.AAC.6